MAVSKIAEIMQIVYRFNLENKNGKLDYTNLFRSALYFVVCNPHRWGSRLYLWHILWVSSFTLNCFIFYAYLSHFHNKFETLRNLVKLRRKIFEVVEELYIYYKAVSIIRIRFINLFLVLTVNIREHSLDRSKNILYYFANNHKGFIFY